MQVGLDILPEKLAKFDNHLLGVLTIVEGVELESPLSSFHHPIHIINLCPDIIIFDAFAQPDVLPPFPATPLYVGQEVLGVDMFAEGTHSQDGVNTRLALPH